MKKKAAKKVAKKAAKRKVAKKAARRRMGRPSKYMPEYCQLAVDCGKLGMGLAEIASRIGVVRSTLWEWSKTKPEFSDALKRAYEEGLAWWEKKGREATFGNVQGFNATSYIFQMKNRFKDDWRDKIDHDVEFTGDIHIKLGGNVDD